MTKVPNDPSLSKEMRRFLDDLARNSKAGGDLEADSLVVTGAAEVGSLSVGGLEPFLQGGTADEGLTHNWVDHGTVTGGTITIDPLSGYFHKVVNNGAFEIVPVSGDPVGSCALHIENGSAAGVVTFTGFTAPYPSALLNTTNTHKFSAVFWFFGTLGVDYMIMARQ